MRSASLLLLMACGPGVFQPPDRTVPPITTDPCTDPVTWYYDSDGDGVGGTSDTLETCGQPSYVWSLRSDDCDDEDAGTYPGAIEVCDGVDRDCSGIVDDATDAARRWYPDADGDGYPDLTARPVLSCERPSGYVAERAADCDDTDPAVNPGAEDPPCDGIDQACLGQATTEVARVARESFDDVGLAILQARGRRVQVCPGVHAIPSMSITQGLWMEGLAASRDDVVLRGTGGRLLQVTGAELRLQGLTLTGGRARSLGDDAGHGGAILATVDTVMLDRIGLSNHRSAGDGGALWLSTRSLDLLDVSVRDTRSDGSGGAVWAEVGGDRLEIVDLDTARTQSGSAGGALWLHHAPPTAGTRTVLRGVSIDQATAGGSGGGLRLETQGNETLVDAVSVRHTRASDAGGALSVVAGETHRLTLQDSVLADGSAELGGLVHAWSPDTLSLLLRGSTLTDGTARDGGLAHLTSRDDAVDVDISGSSLSWGAATETGGLIAISSQARLDVYANRGSFTHGHAARGAALWVEGSLADGSEIDFDNCPLSDHTGAPAIQVGATVVDTALLELTNGLTTLVRNRHGGVQAPAAMTVRFRSIDVGTGDDENGSFDIRSGETTWDGSGSAVRVTCLDARCTEEG